MYRVLMIDDEPNILSALRRCLAGINVDDLDGDALQVETFTSPQAALERSEEQDFDLVMSDYRMPTMSGVEFLSRVMEIQPGAPRVIISGYADREAIIAAINEVHLARFIAKPWNDQELRKSVVTILATSASNTAKRGTNDRNSADVASSRDRQMERLEKESPGLTHLDIADDGGIMLDLDDPEFDDLK